jgi:hypothetical protein
MNKTLLSSAIMLALGTSGSQMAMAGVDLDAATGTISLATELMSETMCTNCTINNTSGNLNVGVELGFGFASGNSDIYVRFDLASAEFETQVADNDLSGTNLTSSVSAGGATGDTYVIFNLTSTGTVTASTGLTFTPSDLTLPSLGAATIQYRLYNQPGDAVNATGSPLKNVTGGVFDFDTDGTVLSVSAGSTTTASVESDFEAFEAGGGYVSDTIARLGSFTITDASSVYTLTSNTSGGYDLSLVTATATELDFLGGSANVVVTGDFGAAATNGVFLSTSTTCASSNVVGTIDSNNTSATFETSNTVRSSATYLCYTVTGSNEIQASEYKFTLNPDGVLALDTADYIDRDFGEIDRGGTTLQATFSSTSNPQVSRFIFINTGSSNAPITAVNVYTNSGVTYTAGSLALPVDIPAKGRKAVQMSEIVSGFSKGKAAGVEFIIGGQCDQVKGTYQYLIAGSDVQTVVQMVPTTVCQ